MGRWLLLMLGLLAVGCLGQPAVPEPTTLHATPVAVVSQPTAVPPTLPPLAASPTADPTLLSPTETPIPALSPTAVPDAQWIYAIVTPFNTVRDGVTWEELEAAWRGQSDLLGGLVLTTDTAVRFQPLLGQPQAAALVEPEEMVEALWTQRGWSLVPFHALHPRLKVLRLDGVAPVDRDFGPENWPLQVQVPNADPNYARERITYLALSGPSGFGRAVGSRIELNGYAYPATHLAPLFESVDFAHFSNEMPFAPNCPASELEPYGDTLFCVPDRYIEVMEALKVNINEMTGNHVNDWGEPNLQHTFDLYAEAGIMTFGGGRNLAEAERPLLLEHNGNRLALVGCNDWGPPYAFATPDKAGAWPCGDFSGIAETIGGLRADGWLVFSTLQYLEHYQYAPTNQQIADFRILAEAGATAVSGSQGHHAQGFDFHNGGFIHYGLGNTVFDQMDWLGTRQSFIDIYLIYDNRLLNIDLWTGLIESYCCPRPMTEAERAQALGQVFGGSVFDGD